MDTFTFDTVWSEEDECFITYSLEHPTISGFGETAADSLRECKVALEGVIAIHNEKRE